MTDLDRVQSLAHAKSVSQTQLILCSGLGNGISAITAGKAIKYERGSMDGSDTGVLVSSRGGTVGGFSDVLTAKG